jgi:hypothetical protein
MASRAVRGSPSQTNCKLPKTSDIPEHEDIVAILRLIIYNSSEKL